MTNSLNARPENKQIVRNGAAISYAVCGEAPTVVLLPSLGRGSEDFDEIFPQLVQAGLRVIMPEPRGIEGSSALLATDTLHDMAEDIAAIIDVEKSPPAVIFGHAAGNWVARVLAHDRPDLTRAVVLASAIVSNEVPEHVKPSISASFDLSRSDEERLGHLRRVYFSPNCDASVWLHGWWPEVSAAQRRAASLTVDKSWLRVADTHETLYIGAADDVISPPPDLQDLRNAIGAKASAVVIDDAGHALLPEQPEAVAKVLTHWISSLPRI